MLIDTVSGSRRRKVYPNGDIVYNNCSLYLVDVDSRNQIRKDSESVQLKFFDINELPELIMDDDLIDEYIKFLSRETFSSLI